MALVEPTSRPNFDANSAVYAAQMGGDLYAGENILAGASCYQASDGLVYMSDATADDKKAHSDGVSPLARKAGQVVQLYGPGLIFRYSDGGLVPGDDYYLAATPGRWSDTPTAGDAVGVARARDTMHLRVLRLK